MPHTASFLRLCYRSGLAFSYLCLKPTRFPAAGHDVFTEETYQTVSCMSRHSTLKIGVLHTDKTYDAYVLSQWYEDSGEPRRQVNGLFGCTHPACFFAHPTDVEWSRALTSRPPEPRALYQEPSPSRNDDRRRDRQPSFSRRARSPPLAPFVPHDRRASTSSFGTETKSPRIGRDLKQRLTSPEPPMTAAVREQPRPRTSTGSGLDVSGTVGRERVDVKADGKNGDDRAERREDKDRLAPTRPLSSEPSSSTLMPPPAVAKTVVRKGSTPNIKDPTRSEKLQLWVERIKYAT